MAAEGDEISLPKPSLPNYNKAEKLAQENALPVSGEERKRQPDRGSSEELEAKRRKKTSGQVSVSSPGNVEKSNVLEEKTKVIGVGSGSGFSFHTTALGSPSPVGITPKFGSFALQVNPDLENVAVDLEINRSGVGDDEEADDEKQL